MSTPSYVLSEALSPGQEADLTQRHITFSAVVKEHTHGDFCEILWVSAGKVLHQINGHDVLMGAGDLVQIRPKDIHRLSAVDQRGGVLHNCAFPPERLVGEMGPQRHWFPQGTRGRSAPLPHSLRLSDNQLMTLHQVETMAMRSNATSSAVLAMLATLRTLCQQASETHTNQVQPIPPWLLDLRSAMTEPAALRQGRPALSRLSGRSIAHISRLWRTYFQETPSVFINEQRIEWARLQLQSTAKSITDIAYDCGYNDLSYFYRIFHHIMGCSPGKFRRQQLLSD